jgi:hypothetical protein
MGFLAIEGQTRMTAFGVYHHRTQPFRHNHHHRTETPAFGPDYYNEVLVKNKMMIGIWSSQLEMELVLSDIVMDLTFTSTTWKLGRFSNQTKHFYILNELGTASITHIEMIVTSIITINTTTKNTLKVIGQSQKALYKGGG